MSTCTIQIGNSDDKLTQREWARFVDDTRAEVASLATAVHFTGFSPSDAVWQNACIVAEIDRAVIDGLTKRLAVLATHYRQDSIALTVGETEFVESSKG